MCAEVICPFCGARRWCTISVIRQQLKRSNFNGQCRTCSNRNSREGTFQTVKRKTGGRRSLTNNGYIVLGPTYVAAEDLPLYRQMQNKAGLFEHRFVMAKKLGRPLAARECVDHMDGIKTNNDPDNLRLYLKGSGQAGDGVGYGTFYHEWQLALAEIVRLKSTG